MRTDCVAAHVHGMRSELLPKGKNRQLDDMMSKMVMSGKSGLPRDLLNMYLMRRAGSIRALAQTFVGQ